MNDHEIEQFILTYGCDILRFCRMTAGGSEAGDDLYQDTMLKLTEKKQTLLLGPHTKSYALSTALFLWKNSRRKYAARNRILPMESVEALEDTGWQCPAQASVISPEQELLQQNELETVRGVVAALPEKYKLLVYLFYSADMRISEIAEILHIPEGTVKTRLRKAKNLLKARLEALGYER